MPGESSTALALSLSPRAMNLSLASVCVDDDGASNASKAKGNFQEVDRPYHHSEQSWHAMSGSSTCMPNFSDARTL